MHCYLTAEDWARFSHRFTEADLRELKVAEKHYKNQAQTSTLLRCVQVPGDLITFTLTTVLYCTVLYCTQNSVYTEFSVHEFQVISALLFRPSTNLLL